MFSPKVVYEKVVNGDSLSNAEVAEGKEFFDNLSNELYRCGPIFRLAAVEAGRIQMKLSDYSSARGLK